MPVQGELLGQAVLELTVDPARMDAGLAAAEKRAGAAADRMGSTVGRKLGSVGKSMESTGKSMSRTFTVPILAAMAATGKLAVDFEQKMELIHTQAGATQREVEAMKGQVLDLAKHSAQGPNDLADALFRLEGAGLHGAKAMDALRAASQLAAVGNANVEDTAKTLSQTWFTGIKGAGTFKDTVAQLNATVGAGDLRLQQLVDALGTGVLGAAKLAGLSLHDVTGALAVFGDETNNVSGWSAQFATALHFITTPTQKATGALESMGLKQFELSADLSKPNGLVLTLKTLKEHLEALPGGLEGVQAKATLGDIFPGGRGRVMTILINQLDRLQGKMKQVADTTGQFNGDVAKTQETAAYQIKNTIASLEASGIKVGNDVLPEILHVGKEVAGEVEKVAGAFSSLPKGAQDAIIKGGLVLAALGPGLTILGKFTSGIGRLYSLATLLGRLSSGKQSLFGGGGAGKATSTVVSMEVGTLIAKSMVGGSVGVGGGAGGSSWKTATSEAGAGRAVVSEAETAGAAGLGSTAAGLLSKALGVAGIAAIATPIALGLGKVLAGIISSNSFGHKVAGSIYSHGFGGDQAPALAKQTAAALDELHQLTTGKQRLGSGPIGRFAATEDLHLQLSQLSPRDQAKVMAAANKAGKLVAKSLEAGWGQYRFQSEPVMFKQLRSKMKDLPPEAQAASVLSAVKFAEGLERQGRLTRGSAARMLRQVESQFPGFEKYLGLSATAGIDQFNKHFDLKSVEQKTNKTLRDISQDFPQVQDAMAKTDGSIREKTASTIKALQRIQSTGTGSMKRQATRDLADLERATEQHMNAMAANVHSNIKNLVHDLGPNTAAASKAGARNMADFADAVTQNIYNGAIGGGKGLNILIDTLNQALHEMGQKKLSNVQVGALTLSVGKTRQLTARGAAQGALHQFGRPGEAGHDSIPVSFGGVPVVVGPGEVGAVLTRHHISDLNHVFAREGGFAGYLSRRDKPNYMAKGGPVGDWRTVVASAESLGGDGYKGNPIQPFGYSELGVPPTAANVGTALGRLPYMTHMRIRAGSREVVAGKQDIGTGSSFDPVMGLYPGTVAQLGLHGGQFNVSIERADGIPLTIGSGASVGAALSAAFTKLSAPGVRGTGTIATMVRAALGKATGAANAYEQAHMPQPAAGGGGGGGPVFPVAAGKVPPQVQWALAAAQNIAARHPDYGHMGAGWGLSAYDCSSYVSTVMDAAGIWPKWTYYTAAEPINAHTMPGPGKWITIATRGTSGNDAHTMMEIDGHFFESSHHGLGPHVDSGWSEPFDQYRHPRGFATGGLMGEGQPGHQPSDAQARMLASGDSPAKRALIAQLNPHLTGSALGGFGKNVAKGKGHGKGPVPTRIGREKPSHHPFPKPRQKAKPVKGFEKLVSAWNSLAADNGAIARLGAWQGYMGNLYPDSDFAATVTLADGTEVVNHDGMIDPSTGQWVKGINQRLGEIGAPHPPWSTNTLLGIDETLLRDYQLEQMIAAQGLGAVGPWAKYMTGDQKGWQQKVNNDNALIERLTMLRERLPQQKKDRLFAITERFKKERHQVQIGSATRSFAASELLSRLEGGLSDEQKKARDGVPGSKPAGWKGDSQAWSAQRRRELDQIDSEFGDRQSALLDAARKHRFEGTLDKSNALFGLTMEEDAEKHKLGDLYDGKSVSIRDTLRGTRTDLKLDTKHVTADQKALDAVIGSGGLKATWQDALSPMSDLLISVLTEKNITIPGWLQEISQLTGTTVTAPTGTSPATDGTLLGLLEQWKASTELTAKVGELQGTVLDQSQALRSLPPFGGSFLWGGTVPGAPGEPRTVIAHGGERITPAGGQGGDTHLHLHFKPGTEWLRDFVHVEVERGTRNIARQAGRPMPGRGGGLIPA